jgi:Polysaccharide pyruvyl transferase
MIRENEKIVGILTFHNGLNHGAFLQAYALMKSIEQLGYNVYIINYKNKVLRYREGYFSLLKFRRPIRFIDFFKKKRAFQISQKCLKLTLKTSDPTEIRKIHFSTAIVGSDVVWDYNKIGLDDLFFGNLNADRIISYAPSFGSVSYNQDLHSSLSSFLKRFHKISVRDQNSKNIIKKVIGIEPPILLDPTLIYDFKSEEVGYHASENLDKYLLVYSYVSNPKLIKRIKQEAEEKKLKIVAVGYRQFWCDKVLMSVGPFEWLSLFKNADLILTSTFHGVVFSIKYQRPFCFIVNKKAYNRVQSLLDICGIPANLQIEEGEVIKFFPDYNLVKENIDPLIRESLNWLIGNLDFI